MKTLAGLNIPERLTDPPAPSEGIIIYSKNGIIHSIDSTGIVEVLTNIGSSGGSGGSNDHVDLPFDAGQPILAYKVITLNNTGHAIYASSDNLNHVNKVLGVSKNAANTGHRITIRNTGLLTNIGWQWSAGQPLYLGLNGDITSSADTGLFSNNIGYAVTETTIFINIGRSIVRG